MIQGNYESLHDRHVALVALHIAFDAYLSRNACQQLPTRAATNSLRRQQYLARCFVGQDLSRVATADGGWSWTDEGRSKWGFLSDTAGAALKLMFNSEMHGPREVNASVRIAFLQTYTPMGVAKVSCIAGCSCDESSIENMWQPGEHTVSAMLPRLHLRHATWLSARVHLKLYIGHTKDCPRLVRLWLMCGASTSAPLVYTILLTLPAPSSPGLPIPPSPLQSQTHMHTVAVSQSPQCTMLVEVLERTASGGHKVKIVGLMVSEDARGAGSEEDHIIEEEGGGFRMNDKGRRRRRRAAA